MNRLVNQQILSVTFCLMTISGCASKNLIETNQVETTKITTAEPGTANAQVVQSINSRAIASEVSDGDLRDMAISVFESPQSEAADEFAQAMSRLVRIYYRARKNVASYDEVLFNIDLRKNASESIVDKKLELLHWQSRILVTRQILAKQELRVLALFERYLWLRFSPTTSRKTFEHARFVQKSLYEKYFRHLQSRKYDAAAFQHIYQKLEKIYSDIVLRSGGHIKNDSGQVVSAPAKLAGAYRFFELDLSTKEALNNLHKDPQAIKYLNQQMTLSHEDEDLNILEQQTTDQVQQLFEVLKAESTRLRTTDTESSEKKIMPTVDVQGTVTGNSFLANTWALIFNGGPDQINSKKIQIELDNADLPGNFFWLGEKFQDFSQQDLVHGIYKSGHIIGNLSWSERPDFSKLSTDPLALKKQFNESQDLIAKSVTDAIRSNYTPKFFLCPFGACLTTVLLRQKVSELGSLNVSYNVDSMDWEDKDPEQIEARLKKQILLEKQGLILFHDTDPQSAIALQKVLKFLKSLETQKRARVISLCQAIDEANGSANAEFCPANQFKWRNK